MYSRPKLAIMINQPISIHCPVTGNDCMPIILFLGCGAASDRTSEQMGLRRGFEIFQWSMSVGSVIIGFHI